MAVEANMVETYDNAVIRDDLQEAYSMISPEEVPFQTAIGTRDADSTYVEWPVVALAAPDVTNRVPEGEEAPPTDSPTLAARLGNYTQISDKKVKVSHTSEAVDAAAEDIQKIGKQVALKIRELKRDMEMMLLQNVPASPGAGQAATTRQAAGFPAFLRTNVIRAAGGINPTLSNSPHGYPNAAATAGTTPVALTESQFNTIIAACWTAGAEPTMALVNAGNKRLILGDLHRRLDPLQGCDRQAAGVGDRRLHLRLWRADHRADAVHPADRRCRGRRQLARLRHRSRVRAGRMAR